MAIFGIGVLFIVYLFVSAMWSGYALSVLWGWFVVPTFHLPALSVPAAIGLCLTVSYMTHQSDGKSDDGDFGDTFGRLVAWGFFKPAIAILIGWIVKQWM